MKYKYSVRLLISLVLLSKFVQTVSSQDATMTRHKKRSTGKKVKEEAERKQQAGTYRTKEQVEKPPKMDHPCNLTRTTVRITFPELKGEVFVNLLGYKEPNLVPVWRCKGVCGDVDSPIACKATKMRQKKVQMTVKTHLYGRDKKERLKELILDEHEECGCQCNDLTAALCAGTFNEKSCECVCEDSVFGGEKSVCVSQSSHYWDERTCQCRSKSVAPRETDAMMGNCLDDFSSLHQYTSGFDMIGYIFLGSCITMAAILTATTLYYRRKLKNLTSSTNKTRNNKSKPGGEIDYNLKKKKRPNWNHPNKTHNDSNGKAIKTESSTSRSYESGGSAGNRHQSTNEPIIPIMFAAALQDFEEDKGREEYDQHGVRIENQVVIDF